VLASYFQSACTCTTAALRRYVPQLRARLGLPHTVVVALPCCVDQSLEASPAALTPEELAFREKNWAWQAAKAAGRAAEAGAGAAAEDAAAPGAAAPAAHKEAAAPAAVVGAAAQFPAQATAQSPGAGWVKARAKQRRARLVKPASEYNDFGVHSNERTVRVFVLGSDGGAKEDDGPLS